MIQILKLQSFTGRNIYSHRPVIRIELDLGEYHDTPTRELQGFNEGLLKILPGLLRHKCSKGYEGGFTDRLAEGTYLAHTIEHMTLELQNRLGYSVCYGKARVLEEPSIYFIIFEHANENCGIACVKAAVQIVNSLIRGEQVNVESLFAELGRLAAEGELGPSTKAIYDEAKRRGIPVSRMGNESLLQLGTGKYQRKIQASLTDAPDCISVDIASNKHLTKQLLGQYNIPVPPGDIAYTEASAVGLARQLGFPVVVKPFDGNQGKGVHLGLDDEEAVKKAFYEAAKLSKAVLVEKYIEGRDYRILVVGGKVSAVAERKPPHITGDGVHTVKELVELENKKPLRGEDHEKPLTKIKLDSVALHVLQRMGYDENSVPPADRIVNLRENGNLSTGGTARECTGEIHPYNAWIAVRAAKVIGLDIAGIDMTIPDIGEPISSGNGAVLEVNAAPGLRMHLHPTEGKPVNVAGDILDMLYPEEAVHSVPIVSITGTNGKTTTTRLIKHTLALSGKITGMTCTSGIYIGNECILKGDNTGPVSAKMVLSNKEVEVAVLETARGGIVRRGLGYDLADVGVVVNVSEDHLGLDGINSLEELAFVKALVIEAVKPEGYAVINADDAMADYLLKRVRSKVLLFSRRKENSMLQHHLKAGGKGVITTDDSIYVCEGELKSFLIKLSDIPITFGGRVECNIENSLAAVSALYGLGVPLEMIRKGLKSFSPDTVTNPGRFNLFDMGDFQVMLDYGHNPAGYAQMIRFLEKVEAERLIGIIGMPGDRQDRSIIEAGSLCGKGFSKIYIKEDNDLRGRTAGEVAGLFYEAALKSGMKKEDIEVIFSETLALETALKNASPGDFIVMFYEEFEAAVEVIKRFKKDQREQEEAEAPGLLEQTAG